MSLSKRHLSKSLKQTLNLRSEVADGIVNAFFEIARESVNSGNTLKLSGFGTFEVVQTKERVGRNPKTMESFDIPSKQKVKFSPTSKSKDFLN